MYKIIGADQKEYGPITGDQIRQWIAEGRVNAQTHACAEGTTEWKPLAMFPEFGFSSELITGEIPGTGSNAPLSAEEILARNYDLDIGSCISRGWELFKCNFGTLFLSFLIFVGMAIATSVLLQGVFTIMGLNRPGGVLIYIQPYVYLVANALVLGPIGGGLYQVYIHTIRGQRASAGEVFVGFQKAFKNLFLGKLITGLLINLCVLPYSLTSAAKMQPYLESLQHQRGNPQEILSQVLSAFMSTLPIFLICLIPATYLSVNWLFTLPLIIDKQMDFLSAMKVSWKMVHKHWLHIFGLVVLVGLLNIGGFCLCCIGALFTVPIGLAAMMYAYEDIFGRKTS